MLFEANSANCLKPDSLTKLDSRSNKEKRGRWWKSWGGHNLPFPPVSAAVRLASIPHWQASPVWELTFLSCQQITALPVQPIDCYEDQIHGAWEMAVPFLLPPPLVGLQLSKERPLSAPVFNPQKPTDPFPDSIPLGIFWVFKPLGKATRLFHSIVLLNLILWPCRIPNLAWEKQNEARQTKQNNMIPSTRL